jgi:transaldolase
MQGLHTSLETVGTEADDIVREARVLRGIADNVVVKIPNTKEGLIAVRRLEGEGIRTNVTLTFSPLQAMLAAKAGASFISPFIERINRIGRRGMDVVEQSLEVFDRYGYRSELITASMHTPVHVLEAAMAGSHICTMPFETLRRLFDHPLTDAGVQKFLDDWQKVPQKDELWKTEPAGV